MARGIYEIKLKNRLFPALSEEDAMEMQINGECRASLSDEDIQVSLLVKEEHTMKLFLLAKTIYETEKFELSEVETAVRALAIQFGYYNIAAEVTDCIITWVERFDEMTPSDLEEWIIG